MESVVPSYRTLRVQERVFYGGAGLLLVMALWIPLALKAEMRFNSLVKLHLPTGFEFINVLLLYGIARLIMTLGTTTEDAQRDRKTSAMAIAIALMFLLSMLSVVTAGATAGAQVLWYAFVDWKRWCTMLLVFFFTQRFLQNRRQVRWLLYAMTLVLVFAAVNILRESMSSGFGHTHFKNELRAGGIFGLGGENDLAGFLAEFIFVPLALFHLERGFLKRVMLLGGAALMAAACMFCYSRGAWIGIVVGGAVYLVRRSGLKGVAILVLLAILVAPFLPRTVVDRWTMTEDKNTGQLESSAASRVLVWQEGIRIISENPLLGVGWNRFLATTSDMTMRLESHNQYLKIAAEEGLPALLAFLFMIFCAFRLSFGARDPFEREIFIALTSCLITFALVNFFGNRFLREPLTSYFWFFTGAVAWLRTRRPQPQPEAES